MDNNLILSLCVALVFLIFKTVEIKLVNKDKRPLLELVKLSLRDTLIVFISTYLGTFILSKIGSSPLTGGSNASSANTQAFTGDANF